MLVMMSIREYLGLLVVKITQTVTVCILRSLSSGNDTTYDGCSTCKVRYLLKSYMRIYYYVSLIFQHNSQAHDLQRCPVRNQALAFATIYEKLFPLPHIVEGVTSHMFFQQPQQ